jgi:hypothetical protein
VRSFAALVRSQPSTAMTTSNADGIQRYV